MSNLSFLPISACCLTGGVLKGTPRGQFEGGDSTGKLRKYKVSPSQPPPGGEQVAGDPKAAIVLFYDAFAFQLPNPTLIADKFADMTGLDVFVPEYLPNPVPIALFQPIAPVYPGEFDSVPFYTRWWKTFWAYVGAIPYLWGMLDGRVLKLVNQAMKDIKADGYEKIGAVGYCRGGAVTLSLLSLGASSPLICGVPLHPGPHDESTWSKITKPTHFHLASQDAFCDETKTLRLEAAATRKREQGVDMCVTVHRETVHGFGERPTLEHEPTKRAFEDANKEAAAFLKKHLTSTG